MVQSKLFFFMLLSLCATETKAQKQTTQQPAYAEPHRWSIEASFGGISQSDDRGDLYSDNEGNAFGLTADYWPACHIALTGGIYAEQLGMMTSLDANGIGPKKYWMAGIEAGAKWYPLPAKWMVQPYIGGTVMTNVLNLPHQYGTKHFSSNIGTAGSATVADYSVQCPAVSLSPKIGVDVHLLRDLSLTFAADYRWGLYGSSKAQVHFNDGAYMGQTKTMDCRMDRTVLQMGLKLYFPMDAVTTASKVQKGLLDTLFFRISSKEK